MEKAILANIPDCLGAKEKSELSLALAAGPLGNLAAEKADQPERASLAQGESTAWREKTSRYTSEAAGGSGSKVV